MLGKHKSRTLTTGRKGRKGFTIIELLVVIAIIAILAALLFPVFVGAKNKAKQGACLVNTRQIALAMQMYISDHDDTFPTVGGEYIGTPMWTSPLGWFHPLEAYVGDRDIFWCPMLKRPVDAAQIGKMIWSGAPGMGVDCIINYSIAAPLYNNPYGLHNAVCGLWWMQAGQYVPYTYPRCMGDVEFPTRVICFNEVGKGWLDYHPAVLLVAGAECGHFSALHLSQPTHNGGLHFGFCDGHVKWLDMTDVPEGVSTWQGVSYDHEYRPY